MSEFQTSVDIGNRALQHCGQRRMVSFTEDYKGASEVAFVYDKLRVAELQRNVWRFAIKHAALRSISTTTMLLVPAAYDATKTYLVGSIVTQSGAIYIANQGVPLATPPADNPGSWEPYYGPLTVTAYDPTLAYYSGELVYTPSTTAAGIYLSTVSNNTDVPTAVPAWSATTTYEVGDTVTAADAVVYQSKADLNINLNPTAGGNPGQWQTVPATQPDVMRGQNWLKLGAAAIKSFKIVYPIGSGPSNQSTTRNVYRLPNGFLRKAPQDPKAGSASYLGAPSGLAYDDWEYEGDFITTRTTQVILLRFVANFSDVTRMHPMFCEGLGARCGLEVVEELTQSAEKLNTIGAKYKLFMGEARQVNAIEIGAEESPEDDYITCRL